MAVIHVLKDGTVLKDITGHVVKMEDVPSVYALIDQMNRKKGKKNVRKSGSQRMAQSER